MKNILSLGAGVQSSTVLMMSIVGELPKLDAAIFADTGWEPPAVYRHFWWLAEQAIAAGIEVYCVGRGTIRSDALVSQIRGIKTDGVRWASLPYFTLGPNGERGMIRRQCTKEYKIDPITKALRALVNPPRGAKSPLCRQWFGISLDEFQRQRSPDVRWIENYYPLIERRMTRRHCLEWHRERGYPDPPRSACIGCPFHSDAEWRLIKADPELWADVVEFDRAIRNCGGTRGQVFLHSSRRPLEEIDFSNDWDKGQLPLWQEECSGMCGV